MLARGVLVALLLFIVAVIVLAFVRRRR